jgi:PKD repeat protein
MKNCTPSLPTSLLCCCPKTRQTISRLNQACNPTWFTGLRFIMLIASMYCLTQNTLLAQSSDCTPNNVQNSNTDNWSEECYLNDSCEEQGNPCQANDVRMIGAFVADINGGPIQVCANGDAAICYLWGRFNNNTNANRYAVRSTTEVFVNGGYQTSANNCSFDVIDDGTEDVILLGPFSHNCGDLLQLLNTWVGWETSAAQCTNPSGDNYVWDCGDYPPAKCYKELAFIDFLTPNFSFACGSSTESTTEICFTNLSDGGEGDLSYDWDFGDGGSSSTENPCHTYTTTNGIYYVTLTVTDESGVSAAAEATINLSEMDCCFLAIDCPDPDAGIFNCEADIPHPDNGNIVVLDSCGPVTVAISDNITGSGCGGDTMYIYRTYNITDGQSATTCQRVFRIIDDTAPLIVCPGDETYTCPAQVPPPNPNLMGTDDNCTGLVAVTVEPDVIINQDCANSYTIVRTYVATDVCGNQVEHAHNIFVNDLVAPLMSCPEDLTVTCPALVPPPSTAQVITSDNCGGTVEVELLPDITTNQQCANQYVITRTFIGTDACGNQVEHSQYITVADLALPTITCPANVTVSCGASVPAPDPSSVIVTDNCGGGVVVTVGADVTLNFECVNSYIISRTYIATDACGNVSTCEQLITVNDIIAPTISCPANVTVSCASLVPDADISAIITTDNCAGDVTVTVNADVVSGLTCANNYLITRVYVATDACGNVATCAQLITVDDNTAPVITTCLANVSVSCADEIPDADFDAIIATDNCGGDIEITAAADVTIGLACANSFTVLRTYIATDVCGNAATCQQTITVDDSEAPGITCLADVTVSCTDEVPAADVSAIVTTDNCGGGVTVTVAADVISNLVCANNYTIVRVYTATDACGNISTCSQMITIDDNEAPEITCIADVEVTCASLVPAANIAAIVAVDNCPGAVVVTVAADVITGLECANNYSISRIYTATDVCGNTATCEQIITVNDEAAPTISCPANLTVSCASLVPAANISLVTATDNCAGAVTVTVAADVITELDCANSYLIARVYTATDVCGNSATCTQLITVNDVIPPVITSCLANVTVTCAAAIPAVDIDAVVATDNCGGAVVISVAADVTTSFACPNEFTILRTYIATDVCGNTATCVQTITVVDNTAPTITCLANVTVSCVDEVPEADVDAIVTTDNCAGDVTVTVSADIVTGLLCLNTYTITRIYTATDGCGNAATCAQIITVDDNTAPSITCPANVTVSCPSQVPAADVAAIVAVDNCGGVTVTVAADVITGLTCANSYLVTRVYTATDACGNTAICTQLITVDDNTAPTITCPANVTVSCASAVPAANVGAVVTTDNCGGTATVTVAADVITGLTCANSYTITRVYTATDACGNTATCAQTITVDDNTAPTITCPANVTVSCANAVPAADIAAVITSDNCVGVVTVTVAADVITGLVCANSYIITRTYTAVDVCGNSATCSQTITVDDNTPPVITSCIADVTVACAAGVPAANVGAIIATDNCAGAVAITVAADVTTSFACANEYTLLRTYIATDVCGNTATCAQTITVVDNTAPVITCPVNVTVSCAGEVPAANVAAVVTSDNCAGAVTVTVAADVITGLTCANTYTITRIYTATDGCGNAATCAQIITVDDNTPPTITCPANVTVSCASAVPAANVAAVVASDNCGGVTVTVAADVVTSLGCPNNFLVTRVYTATDACGNAATCTQTILVDDNTAPVITCPANVTVSCASAVPAVNIAAVVTSDNCGGTVVVTASADVITGLTCPNSFTITRIYTATDACGNTATCTQTITVDDNTPPTISCPANVTVSCASAIPAANVNALLTSDNCSGPVTVTVAADVTTSLVCANSFIISRTYSAVDVCGNVATCTQTITVDDNTPPVIATCIADVTVTCAAGIPAANVGAIIATDNCAGSVAITVAADVTTSLACPNEMTIVRTYIATDVCGNSATCAQTITVVDDSAPSITCPANLTVSCASAVPAANVAAVVASDNCGAVTVTVAADVVTSLGCPNNYLVTRVYTATDACGNAATCTQTILVDDNTAPVITCPANLTVSCASAVPAADVAAIVASDNCGPVTVTVAADVINGLSCANSYLITRVYTATDACGNTSICTQLISVDDSVAPVITCPANVTVSCASAVPAADIAAVVATDNCGGGVTVSVAADVITNQSCPNTYTILRTYSAVDVCGNTATCTQTITVDDNTLPVISGCPASITVACAADVPAGTLTGVTATDNCGGTVSLTLSPDVTVNQTCPNVYTILRTYTAVDVCGNSATCQQSIIVSDTIAPVIVVCPADITMECTGQFPPADISLVEATDNCAGAVVITHESDSLIGTGCNVELIRTYSATDACGNQSLCVQVITLFDTLLPEMIMLDPLLAPLSEGDTLIVQCHGQNPEWDLPVFSAESVEASDNCSANLVPDYDLSLAASGDCAVDGFINVYQMRWDAVDSCGNAESLVYYMALVDTVAPVLVGVPADITVDADDIPAAPYIYATDECLCACAMLVEESALDEGCMDGQVIIRTWSSVDDCGNQAIAVQRITIVDTTGPTLALQLPDNMSIPNGAVLTYRCEEGGIPAIFDNMDDQSMNLDEHSVPMHVSFEQVIDQPSNCEFAGYLESRELTWSALDGCGNTSSFSFTIVLTDGQAPEILNAPDMACVGDPILDFIEATDNCAHASLRFWDVEVDNPCGEGKAMRRTYEAFDDCGNMSRDTVMLIPDDNVAPQMAFVHPDLMAMEDGDTLTISCQAASGKYTPYSIEDVVALDSCVSGVEVAFDERIIRFGDCENDGYVALMELIWTATDHCGNFTTTSVMATVVDDIAPTFVDFLPEITIGCNDSLPNPEVYDNCGTVTMQFNDTQVPGPCEYEYDVIRLIKIVDDCGNVSTATQIVHVGDGTGPDIEGVVEEVCDDLTMPVVTAYDPCSDRIVDVSMTQDTLDNVCADGMIIRRVWSAVDACGNIATIEQLIYMGDTIAPEIMIPSWSVIRDFMDQDTIPVVMMTDTEVMDDLNALYAGSIIARDNCDEEIDAAFDVDVQYSATPLIDGYNEQRYYVWLVSDACGNADSVFFTVNIIDNLPTGELPNDTTVLCAPLPPAANMAPDPSNGIVDVEFSETIVPSDVAGEFIVTRIWVMTLINGSQSSVTQKIRWVPDTGLSCDIIVPDTVDCNSHGIIVTANVAGGVAPYSYLWEIEGDDCFIQGGQGTPEIAVYIGWGPVVIRLTVIDAFGCETTCEIIVPCSEEANLGFGDNEFFGNNNSTNQTVTAASEPIDNIAVYPNPTDNFVKLAFESQLKDKIDVTLINFIGDKVLNNTIPTLKGLNTHQLDLSNLPDGIYILRIETQDKLYTRTITVLSKD